MKITDTPKSAPLRGAQPAKEPTRSEKAATPTPGDSVSFRGVPDTELTPRVREALISLIEEVTALHKELAEAQARMRDLEQIAETDPLLGIPNRRAFVRELNRTLAMVERYGAPASLIFADLDNLKIINDQFGHAGGDAALIHVGKVISDNIRVTDTLGRLGGDEFGVILLQADQSMAAEKAQALADTIASAPVEWRENLINAEISYGVVEIRKGWSVDEALETADLAMYQAKRGSRS